MKVSAALAMFGPCLLLAGCLHQPGAPEPEWPEKPSPSYPNPSAKADDEAPAELDQPERDAVPKAASSFAKEYDGKKAVATMSGQATYYADSLAGNHTANGDVYNPKEFTAAHKKLAFGTIARVIREDTGAVTYVRINDRGPFGSKDRIIDLSKAAAQELNMMKAGVVGVRVEVVDTPE